MRVPGGYELGVCELRCGSVRVTLAGEVRQSHPEHAAAVTLPCSALTGCPVELGNQGPPRLRHKAVVAALGLCSGDLGEAERGACIPQTHAPPGQAGSEVHSVGSGGGD